MNTIFIACRTFIVIFAVASAVMSAYAAGAGSLDLSFNGSGYKQETFTGQNGSEGAYQTIVQPDGKILVGVARFSLARYNPDGSLDMTFGTAGKVVTPLGLLTSQSPSDMALQPDGKIVVAGTKSTPGGPTERAIMVVRYNADGSIDTAFGANGIVTTSVQSVNARATQVQVQPDGKIVIAGEAMTIFPSVMSLLVVARYNPDGSLDTSFDGDGKLINSAVSVWYGGALLIQPDNKILVAGENVTGDSTLDVFAVVRFNANGSLDSGFGAGGMVTTQMGTRHSAVRSLKLMLDGRIVAGGFTVNEGSTDIDPAVARYNPDGSLDTSFNGTGKVLTHLTNNFDYLEDVAVQPDGKIVATGAMSFGDISLLRYNTDGTLDNSYGTGGLANFNLGGSEATHSIALDAAGRAVVVGHSTNTATLIARITAEAAPLVDVGGRVTKTNGQGIAGVPMVLTGADGVSHYSLTNGLGYYVFPSVSSNEIYTINASSKRYSFLPDERSVTLLSTIFGVDFTGTTNESTRVIGKTVSGKLSQNLKR